jgi:putative transposase
MDESYLVAATRYVELNPVRAGLSERPEDYRWSSAMAHLSGHDDRLVKVTPLLEMVKDWREFLLEEVDDQKAKEIRRHEQTGRPLGEEGFINGLEKVLNRSLHRQKPGPKKKL